MFNAITGPGIIKTLVTKVKSMFKRLVVLERFDTSYDMNISASLSFNLYDGLSAGVSVDPVCAVDVNIDTYQAVGTVRVFGHGLIVGVRFRHYAWECDED